MRPSTSGSRCTPRASSGWPSSPSSSGPITTIRERASSCVCENITSKFNHHLIQKSTKDTVPKDSENFVTNIYRAGRLVSERKVFVIDSRRPADTVISNGI
jgi:hypothetical protein